MTTQNIFDLVDTWALSGGPYTSIKMNATDNDAASASLLMDLQVGTVSQFKVSKAGVTNVRGDILPFADNGINIGSNALRINTLTAATAFRLTSAGAFDWSDTFLTRRAAANLRLGAADTTGTNAPTAQFLSAQSWASSTTNNQTGANFTIDGSQGTGTGAGGSIIFRVAPAGGTSNGVQNALSDALTIDSSRITTAIALKVAESSGRIYLGGNSGGTGTNLYANGGTSIFFTFNGSQTLNLNSTGPQVYNSGSFSWSSVATGNGTPDVLLYRDAANTLALRNSTAAQRFNVYNTWTSSTNYEAFKIDWITTANTVLVGTEKGSGGGTARNMEFQTDGTTRMTIGVFGPSLPAGSVLAWAGRAALVSPADGIIKLRNANDNDFDRLQFGGTTPSFPAIKRSSTTLQARLADDSAFAPVQGKLTTDTAYTAGAIVATGYLTLYDSTGTAYRVPCVV